MSACKCAVMLHYFTIHAAPASMVNAAPVRTSALRAREEMSMFVCVKNILGILGLPLGCLLMKSEGCGGYGRFLS